MKPIRKYTRREIAENSTWRKYSGIEYSKYSDFCDHSGMNKEGYIMYCFVCGLQVRRFLLDGKWYMVEGGIRSSVTRTYWL